MTIDFAVAAAVVVSAPAVIWATLRAQSAVESFSESPPAVVSNDPFAGTEPCGYCGTALDPEVICARCWEAVHAERDVPCGDHWR